MANILLVEDDQWMADCYQDWLRADHSVHHVRDAQGALDAADAQTPDVIVLDLFLPHANGVQLLHTLRSYTDLARVPVVLCSNQLPDALPRLAAYGVCQVVDKAVLTPQLLRQAVQGALTHAPL